MISEHWHLRSDAQPGHIARGSESLYLKANLCGLKYGGLGSSTAQQLRLQTALPGTNGSGFEYALLLRTVSYS